VKLTLLGTGTSFGVPVVGCDCRVCTSGDPRDSRSRSGALLDFGGHRLLIDAGPELRLQLLREQVDRIDGLWITHPHADHVHGLDDLRIFTTRYRTSIPAWIAEDHAAELQQRFPYIFDTDFEPPAGTTKPRIGLEPIAPDAPVEILGKTFHPFLLPHGPATTLGFRVGRLGYVTDAKSIPDAAMEALRGVDTLILNALWWGNPHPTHFNIEEAIEVAREVGARQTWLVHLTHRVLHAELASELPEGILPGHDGLTIEIPECL